VRITWRDMARSDGISKSLHSRSLSSPRWRGLGRQRDEASALTELKAWKTGHSGTEPSSHCAVISSRPYASFSKSAILRRTSARCSRVIALTSAQAQSLPSTPRRTDKDARRRGRLDSLMTLRLRQMACAQPARKAPSSSRCRDFVSQLMKLSKSAGRS
jgi:hypothetical protein